MLTSTLNRFDRMPKKREKSDCVEIRVCIDDEMNEDIERFRAAQRSEGKKLRKPEATIELIRKGLKK